MRMSSRKERTLKQDIFGNFLVVRIERFLSWRKKRHYLKREKQKKKHPLRDWLEAIVWALFFVLLIQQFFFELYVIPTGSMIPEIAIGSRVVVEKMTYGPEIIPGKIKAPGFRGPQRGEVIMFENPSIPSLSPLINILHKILYRLTLTMVDIDKDPGGTPRHRLLLKRVIAISGDRLRMRDGDVEIKVAGSPVWQTEAELMQELRLEYTIRRDFNSANPQDFYSRGTRAKAQEYAKNPYNRELGQAWLATEFGWIIPEKAFFPMGDNRDISLDARSYGPVSERRLLGQAVFRIWPLGRIGKIQ